MKLHANTDFDPEMQAVAIVEELEREALDENMMHAALHQFTDILSQRSMVSEGILQKENENRVLDNRRELMAAKVKGVKPVPRGGGVIQPASIIPSRH